MNQQNAKYIDDIQAHRQVPFQVLEDSVMKSAGLPDKPGKPGRKFLHLLERRYLLKGAYNKYWISSRTDTPSQSPQDKKPDAVIICAVIDESYLVLTSELRIGLGSYEIGFPAGLVDEGESPADAAKREFREETGLDLEVTRVSPNLYSSAGMTEEAVPMVYGKASGTVSDEYLERNENIIVILATPSFVQRVVAGEFDLAYGAKAWCAMSGILTDDGKNFRV